MCDITMALSLAGTIISGIGSIQQGMAAAQAAAYNAQVAEMNATMSERRAKDALERGKQAEQQKRFEIAAIQGRQRAAMGANGVDMTFGSPLDTLVDTAVLGEIDALTIRRNAAREAYDFQVDAVNGRADAALSRMNGQSQMIGGFLGAASTVLSGTGSVLRDQRDQKQQRRLLA